MTLERADPLGRLTRIIDAMGQAVLLIDASGREWHRTPLLAQLVSADPEGERLVRWMVGSGRSLAARRVTPGSGSGAVHCAMESAGAYTIRASLVEGVLAEGHTAVLVTLSRIDPSRPTASSLSGRFDLTPRQAEVALLLARGKSNREIADELFISPHTSHHHTEVVFQKLGVQSRAEVAARVHTDETGAWLGSRA